MNVVQPIRRRITEILKENGSATVAELAEQLGIAQVSVRHHLDILIGEDMVEAVGVRPPGGASEPCRRDCWAAGQRRAAVRATDYSGGRMNP
jgi:DNA-binding transcriptional ArsR family regulator